jgi:hypothetical protein
MVQSHVNSSGLVRPLVLYDTGQTPADAPAAVGTGLFSLWLHLSWLLACHDEHFCRLTAILCSIWQTFQSYCVDMLPSSLVTQDQRLIPIRSS